MTFPNLLAPLGSGSQLTSLHVACLQFSPDLVHAETNLLSVHHFPAIVGELKNLRVLKVSFYHASLHSRMFLKSNHNICLS